MEKVLSVVVPCYNSSAYMEHAVNSLLSGGEDMEILIVDDGSAKDNTLEIAQRLEAEHPGIVRAIHQENKGHGGALNTGMANATGRFFKVVDSDDWVDEGSLKRIVAFLKQCMAENRELDMLISNFIYDKVGKEKKQVMKYTNVLPVNEFFGWEAMGRFRVTQYILMHSVIYRLGLLKEINLHIPEHCFYVDNLYVYQPMPYVKTMYYMDEDLYHYFIGRDDQSVNLEIMVKRIDQQYKVNYAMFDAVNLEELKNSKMRRYMYNYLFDVCIVTSNVARHVGTDEADQRLYKMWDDFSEKNPVMSAKLQKRVLIKLARTKGKFGRSFVNGCYKIYRAYSGAD